MLQKYSILFLLVFLNSTAQEMDYVPQTPEAAALTKMVNYPVGYSTGVPDIGVPFYEIKSGELELNIGLDYNASGFKINEEATREGMGWSLTGDLQITRVINGTSDFNTGGGYLHANSIKSYTTSQSSRYPFEDNFNAYWLASGERDGMPDQFNYRLLNKTGSFYFRKNASGTGYNIVTVPHDDIKITWETDVFKIVDSDGTIYNFGVTGPVDDENYDLKAKEITGGQVTTWKCTSVQNLKGDEISFKYEKQSEKTRISFTDKVEYYYKPDLNMAWPYGQGAIYGSNEYPINNSTYFNSYNQNEYQNILNQVSFFQISSPKYMVYYPGHSEFHVPYLNNGELVDRYYDHWENSKSISYSKSLALSEINFKGGRVLLYGTEELDRIRVEDVNEKEYKTLKLYHSYAQSYVDGVSYNTRYLDSVHIKNGTRSFDRYVMQYTEKVGFGGYLVGHDFWGYRNHSTKNYDQFESKLTMPQKKVNNPKVFDPSYDTNGSTYYDTNLTVDIGGDDDWAEFPNVQERLKGMLVRLYQPTGGYVEFDYEPNLYLAAPTSNNSRKVPQVSGGLRIRSISNFDSTYVMKGQKYYRYGDYEEGTGLLGFTPTFKEASALQNFYDTQNYTQKILYLEQVNNNLNKVHLEEKTTHTSSSVLNYGYSNGAPIYYTKVTEYNKDMGHATGKKVYTYYEPNHFVTPSSLNRRGLIQGTNIPYLSVDWMRGAQKSIESYNYSDEKGFELKQRKSFEYQKRVDAEQIRVVNAFFKTICQVLGVSGNNSEIYTGFDLYNHDYRSDGLVDYMTADYGLEVGRLLLFKEKNEYINDGSVQKDSILYYYDNANYIQPSRIVSTNGSGDLIETHYKYPYDFSGAPYSDMVTKNVVSPVVEQWSVYKGTNKEISRERKMYDDPYFSFFAPLSIKSSKRGNPLETDASFVYNSEGNVVELTRKNGSNTSFIWGYNGLYPVAKLDGVAWAAIPSTYKNNSSFNTGTNIEAALGQLRDHYAETEAQVTTFSYDYLIGPRRITQPNAGFVDYQYDDIGRLVTTKDGTGNLLNSFEYHYKDFKIPVYTLAFTGGPPVTQTIGFDCDNMIPKNIVVEGGDYPTLTDAENKAQDIAKTYDFYDNDPDPCSDFAHSNPASLTFNSFFYRVLGNVPRNYPLRIWVDFFQDGSLVASQRVYTSDQLATESPTITRLNLNGGEYEVSFRLNADVHYQYGLIPQVTVTRTGNTVQIPLVGHTMQLDGGYSYNFKLEF